MTKAEFGPLFTKLELAYDIQHTAGEISSYFTELNGHDVRDFAVAVGRLPANEPRTAYKPFPTAKLIREYVLDAQETRRLQEKREMPQSIDEAITRSVEKGERHPSEQAFGHLACSIVRAVVLKNLHERQPSIRAFLLEHNDWLKDHADLRDWLQEQLREASK